MIRSRVSGQEIEGVLHQIELSQRKKGTNYGLNIASGLVNSWIHGGVFTLLVHSSYSFLSLAHSFSRLNLFFVSVFVSVSVSGLSICLRGSGCD